MFFKKNPKLYGMIKIMRLYKQFHIILYNAMHQARRIKSNLSEFCRSVAVKNEICRAKFIQAFSQQ